MNSDHPTLPAPATPPRRPAKRSNQAVGEHFDSPQRRRRWRQDSETVIRPGLPLIENQLTAELEGLFKTYDKSRGDDPDDIPSLPVDPIGEDAATHSLISHSFDQTVEDPSGVAPSPNVQDGPHSKRLLPDDASRRLYSNWLLLIPTLTDDYLAYMGRIQGRLGRPLGIETFSCPIGRCLPRSCDILCLHIDCTSRHRHSRHMLNHSYVDLETVEFKTCDCATLPQVLVRNGLFPTAPLHPRMAVSIDLLDFYSALFDRSADAVTALAGALKTMYSRRGFPLLNSKATLALFTSCYNTQDASS